MKHYTTIYNKTRKKSDIVLPIQKQIISDYMRLHDRGLIITDASFNQDTKQCTDILIINPINSKSVMVGVRMRQDNYNGAYLNDISIRGELMSITGNKITTEIDKLNASGARLMVYTWFSVNNKPIVTYIISINKLIPYLATPDAIKTNNDGSTGNYYTTIDDNGNLKPWVIKVIQN